VNQAAYQLRQELR